MEACSLEGSSSRPISILLVRLKPSPSSTGRLTESLRLGRALELDLNVHGAPNFRAPRQGDLNVFGAAQPRSQGLRAILSVLRARPGVPNPSHVVWFSTREEPIGKSSEYGLLRLMAHGMFNVGPRREGCLGLPYRA